MALDTYRVLVTPTSYGKYDDRLKTELEAQIGEVVYNTTGKPFSAGQLVDMVGEFDGYIAGLDEISAAVIKAAEQLQVIARYGVGVDNVDLDAAEAAGIVVTNTPGANSASVAELAVGLMIATARNVVTAARATRDGGWPRMRGLSLDGKVVGLYGFGSIGKEVARRLAGFDCRVTAYDIVRDEEFAEAHDVTFCSRDELLRQSDVLSLHCPLVPDTRGMVDAGFLTQMKTGAILINTARGELVDEPALLDALDSEKLRAVGMDVFAQQPPAADNPLLQHPRVIATPHMGAHTDGAANAMGWGAFENCLAVLRGEEPANRVV